MGLVIGSSADITSGFRSSPAVGPVQLAIISLCSEGQAFAVAHRILLKGFFPAGQWGRRLAGKAGAGGHGQG